MSGENRLWTPFPGPQTRFCASSEFEVLFGGAKGPGKSDAILMAALRQVDRPKYKALILRATFPELQELIDRSHRLFPYMENPPHWNASVKRWQWGSGAILQFGYCAKLEDVERYHGQEYAYIGFDELGNLPEERVWERLTAECRCPDHSVVRMMRATANPGGPGHPWLKRRFVEPCGKDGKRIYEEMIAGFIITRRYIPARVIDNPVYANDPQYMATLMALPDLLRRQLLYGDWDAGFGIALDELDRTTHMVQPFVVPNHWYQFGSFDWGFSHPWVFGWFASDEVGRVYLVDTIKGRRMHDTDILDRIWSKVDMSRLMYTVAGHDCWADYKAHRGDNTPNTAERFAMGGIPLAKADTNRKQGLNNFRHFLKWKNQGEEGADLPPWFFMMDTPGNRATFATLQEMVVDPDDMEDALKVGADPLTGEGGDDAYDMVRYGLASRPAPADEPEPEEPLYAWDPAVLAREAEKRRHRSSKMTESAYPPPSDLFT